MDQSTKQKGAPRVQRAADLRPHPRHAAQGRRRRRRRREVRGQRQFHDGGVDALFGGHLQGMTIMKTKGVFPQRNCSVDDPTPRNATDFESHGWKEIKISSNFRSGFRLYFCLSPGTSMFKQCCVGLQGVRVSRVLSFVDTFVKYSTCR